MSLPPSLLWVGWPTAPPPFEPARPRSRLDLNLSSIETSNMSIVVSYTRYRSFIFLVPVLLDSSASTVAITDQSDQHLHYDYPCGLWNGLGAAFSSAS